MNNPNKIDRFDEMLRLIYLEQIKGMESEQVQQELSRVLASNEATMSPENEGVIMTRLATLMQQPSFGQLIQRAIKEDNIEDKLLVEKTGMTPVLIRELKNDAIFPN